MAEDEAVRISERTKAALAAAKLTESLSVGGAQRLKGLAVRPGRREMDALAEPWRPYRSAAARFLWHMYRHPGVV